ncbi:MAG TPA: PAS domain S-box protein [Actinomycetota bacterium]|nr:PAS domain S-box protein [Actinomycetota bacterium]
MPVVAIYVVAGLLAILNAVGADDHPRPAELIVLLGLVDVAAGFVIALLPWHAWPRYAPLVLVPFSLALIETFAWAHALSEGTYPIFFVVLFIWVGLALPPRTAIYLSPVTLIAYVTPLWTNAHVGDVTESVGLVVPVCVLVAETVSRFARSARDADRRAAALEHEKARASVERDLREQAYESAQRLQALIHQLPGTVWTTDTNLRLLWGEGNTPVEVEDGDNLYGVTVGDLYGKDDESSPVPAHESALRGDTSTFETEFQGVVLRGSVAPRRDSQGRVIGTVGVALDVTEEARARDVARMQAVFLAESPASNIVTDLDGCVTYWSPASEKIFGYAAAEAMGRRIVDLAILPEDDELAREVFERIVSGGKWSGEWHIRRRDGELVWIWTSLTPLRDEEGAITGVLGTAVDITQRKSLEAQLLQAQRLESVGQLAGGVAHDFNNLLSVIMSYAELLLEALDPDDPRREDVTVVLDAGRKGAALTRQLLTFARREVSMPRVLDLNEVVKEMERLLSRTLGGGVDLDFSLGDVPPVRVDPGQLEQVVMNLVVNANDAMPDGGVLRVETSTVTVDADFGPIPGSLRPGSYARLTVTDSGVGMDPEVRERIFEPFYTTKRSDGGTGLGLPTVHGIVTKAGGTIDVYSEPGLGTTLNVYLPAAAPTTDEVEALVSRTEVAPGGGELILVAEDEDAVRAAIERVLSGSGYRVLTAASGADAVEIAGAAGEPIDLLLTDIVMPKMSGKDLSDALEVKTIFMSGYTQQLVADKGMLEEGRTLIQKPFAAKDLLALVRSMLDDEHEGAGRRAGG